MPTTLRQKHSFHSSQSDRDILSLKQKASTQNQSSCKTIESDFNQDFVSAQPKIKKNNSILINTLMERIKKMQKAQKEAKQKFQMCISTLTKQIQKKDAQNKKINQEIKQLRVQIVEQKRDLQIIKNYTTKLGAKIANSTNLKNSKQEKKNSPIKQTILSSRQKVSSRSNGKLFKKAMMVK